MSRVPRSPLHPPFWIALLVGGSLVIVSAMIPALHHTPLEQIGHLVRDVGLAGLISSGVYGLIEFHNFTRSKDEALREAREVIFGTMAPKELWTELSNSLIEQGVSCEQWHYDCELSEVAAASSAVVGPPAGVSGLFLAIGTLRYQLVNHTPGDRPVELRHELQSVHIGTTDKGPVPRYLALAYTVTDEAGNETREELAEDALVRLVDAARPELLAHGVTIPARGRVTVELKRREVVLAPGEYPWYVFWLTKSPRLTLRNLVPNRLTTYVLLRHHGNVTTRQVRGGNDWELPSYLLPGQGFAIITRPKG